MRQSMLVLVAVLGSALLFGLAQGIGVRDELPAFEPMHSIGLHAGRRICPMCTYGSEAGLVAFIPASLSMEDARRLRNTLDLAALGVTSRQFRVFVIVTGAASGEMVETLRSNDARWFVASLTGEQLKNAERDFGRSLSLKTWGYSFSHRKLLRELSADQLYGSRASEIRLAANDAAQTFVQAEFATRAHRVTTAERVVGLPCEGCELVFAELPEKIGLRSRIASEEEPGQPFRLSGHVVNGEGRPVPGVIVYAYHTNDAGRYPRGSAGVFHGKLRAWAQTDAQGFYEFVTIRPGGYPGRPDPAHIHMHIIEPGRCTYYIDDVVFDDDPRLTSRHVGIRAGSGKTSPNRNVKGNWTATRDIYLGREIPGYEQCGTSGG